jgi:hypothetical protein
MILSYRIAPEKLIIYLLKIKHGACEPRAGRGLLDGVREFVGNQMLAMHSCGRVVAVAKNNVLSHSIGFGVDRASGLGGGPADVHTDMAEINAARVGIGGVRDGGGDPVGLLLMETASLIHSHPGASDRWGRANANLAEVVTEASFHEGAGGWVEWLAGRA